MENYTIEQKHPKYFEVKNKYLAGALAFLGFRYLKFSNDRTTNIQTYGFEDTIKLREALQDILIIKNKYNKY